MSEPANILGKIGKKVGEELKGFRSTSDNKYATQVSLGTTDGQVSINSSAIVSLGQSIVSLGNASSQDYATKVSLNNYKTGVNVFTDLSATRASIGDLTVTGTTTTLNTQTVVIEDNIIEVNLKSDGTESAQTGGIQVNRGLGSTASHTMTKVMQDTLSSNVATWLISVDPTGALASATTFELQSMSASNAPEPLLSGKFLWDSNSNTIHMFVGNGFSADSFSDTNKIYEWTSQSGSSEVLISNSGFQFGYTEVGGNNYINLNTFYGSTQFTSVAGNNADKASIIWDDNTGQSIWKFGLGSADADIKVKGVNASGTVAVVSGDALTINTVAIGDYAQFTAGLALGKA